MGFMKRLFLKTRAQRGPLGKRLLGASTEGDGDGPWLILGGYDDTQRHDT